MAPSCLLVDYFNSEERCRWSILFRFLSKKNLDISFISTYGDVCFLRMQYKYLTNREIKILKQFLCALAKEKN